MATARSSSSTSRGTNAAQPVILASRVRRLRIADGLIHEPTAFVDGLPNNSHYIAWEDGHVANHFWEIRPGKDGDQWTAGILDQDRLAHWDDIGQGREVTAWIDFSRRVMHSEPHEFGVMSMAPGTWVDDPRIDEALADQALGPFLNPVEMANISKAQVIVDGQALFDIVTTYDKEGSERAAADVSPG